MLRVIVSLTGLLLLAGCASNRDLQWWASMTAAHQAASEKRMAEADARWAEALAAAERSGPENWRVSSTLQRLARFYESQGRMAEAEQAFKRALAIQEKIAPQGPARARTLTDLAHLYHGEGRLNEAEPLYRQALPLTEVAFGPDHRNVEVVRYLLAKLYAQQGRSDEAEALYKQLVFSKTFDPLSWRELAQLYESQGRYTEAEPLRRRLVTYRETSGSPRELARELVSLAALVRKSDRPAEAAAIEARAHAVLGEDTVEVLSVTAPEVRRTINGFTEFEMTATVQYALRTADAASLQVSAIRYQSAGCQPGTTFALSAGPLLPITRGEGRQVIPVRWMVQPGGPDLLGSVEGYVTVRPDLWSGPADKPPRLIRSFAQPKGSCYAFQVAGSTQSD